MSYNPENFGDVADLAGVVQRRQNLNELRSLNANFEAAHENAKLQASFQDTLFNFKIMTDNIDKTLNGGHPECLVMIYNVKSQFQSTGFSHEMFSSLEYKNLFLQLTAYLSDIDNKARNLLGDILYRKGEMLVESHLRQQQDNKEAAKRAEAQRLKKENDERLKSDNLMWLVIIGIVLLFGVLGLILIINNPSIFPVK